MESGGGKTILLSLISELDVCREGTIFYNGEDLKSINRGRYLGWIVLYDRECKTLAKVDSYLENLDMLKEYLAFYGIKR